MKKIHVFESMIDSAEAPTVSLFHKACEYLKGSPCYDCTKLDDGICGSCEAPGSEEEEAEQV